jgi:hypothetical protein
MLADTFPNKWPKSMDQISWSTTDKPSPTNAAFIPLTDKQAAEVGDEAAIEEAMAADEVDKAATDADFRRMAKVNIAWKITMASCHNRNEKTWFEEGIEHGEDHGKVCIMVCSLYELKSAGGRHFALFWHRHYTRTQATPSPRRRTHMCGYAK